MNYPFKFSLIALHEGICLMKNCELKICFICSQNLSVRLFFVLFFRTWTVVRYVKASYRNFAQSILYSVDSHSTVVLNLWPPLSSPAKPNSLAAQPSFCNSQTSLIMNLRDSSSSRCLSGSSSGEAERLACNQRSILACICISKESRRLDWLRISNYEHCL